MQLISVITMLLAINLFAQTHVEVEPKYPLNCEKSDHQMVSQVENISTYENESTLEVYFDTYHFSCINQQIYHRDISQPYVNVWKSGMTMPWHYVPHAEVTQDGRVLAKVKVIFNKKKIFKNRNYRKYSYDFFPYAQSDYRYPWDMHLTYYPGLDKTEIIIK
ncbi:MAG: hypothetical protein CME62_15530 [Halobacteriovoraceae bacterium]|nr:hypothetical protein [Halobacteriovoraceae bacterium]